MMQFDITEDRCIKNLRAVVELASGNWPRTADVRVETCGCDPKGSVTIPAYLLRKILDEVSGKE